MVIARLSCLQTTTPLVPTRGGQPTQRASLGMPHAYHSLMPRESPALGALIGSLQIFKGYICEKYNSSQQFLNLPVAWLVHHFKTSLVFAGEEALYLGYSPTLTPVVPRITGQFLAYMASTCECPSWEIT
ncbi:uncharacterized protein PV06_01139 [Exophiala oligosperma]|uniref:Uncharacterized protein n=1 Tax=Exophiala oligosperma TaxID=215243 RepID=A0A0D2B8Q1_9EURO|nr:uncharacterized protein PV06_01139 [Exophiala oligosperma]KIW48566.1 hypothetical protein PV06_01139 [Exophiala oligosperma]